MAGHAEHSGECRGPPGPHGQGMTDLSTTPGPIPSLLPVAGLAAASAVRGAIDLAHVARLCEVLVGCPPITVTTDGVIVDGAHRLEAARRLGWETIPGVALPSLTEAEVLLAAAEANSGHGLPLTREERRRAVEHLLYLDPALSDRRVAQACGVARSVVEAARTAQRPCSGGASDHVNRRVGADGKRYPASRRDLGPIAAAVVRLMPAMTVRDLARLLDVSTGTAHRLRAETLECMRRERRWTLLFRRLVARWRLWRARFTW